MLEENLMNFNKLYQTLKGDLRPENAKGEWETFVANFNAIFEKLANENDDLRMRLSCAQNSSRSNYPNQPFDRMSNGFKECHSHSKFSDPSDRTGANAFGLETSRTKESMTRIAAEQKFLLEKEALIDENK